MGSCCYPASRKVYSYNSMSNGVSVKIRSKGLERALRALGDFAEMGKEAGAIRLNQLFRDHFAALHNERHRDGGSGFYAKASDSVFHRVTREGIYVGTKQQGLRQRLKGGEIRPRKAKALTIPIHPDAYGKRASDSSLGDLFMIRSQSGVALLGRSDGDQFIPYYLLLKSVNQDADPSVIPSEADIMNTLTPALRDTLNIIKRRN